MLERQPRGRSPNPQSVGPERGGDLPWVTQKVLERGKGWRNLTR